MNDADARALIVAQWPAVIPDVHPNLAALQAVQSVGREESGYGTKFRGNWGAIQGGRPDAHGDCPAGTFKHVDTHADGSAYVACFKLYQDDAAAVRDLIREVFVAHGRKATVLPAALSGDQVAFDRALRRSGYYELPLAQHVKATTRNVAAIAHNLGEPVALINRHTGAVLAVSLAAGTLAAGVKAWLARRRRSA